MENRSIAAEIAKREDAQAGRTIPLWRYQLEFYLLAGGSYVTGFIVERTGPELWKIVVFATVAVVAHALILGPYRKRELR